MTRGWQGPLNGGSTPYQYLYCGSSSSQPHQLTGLYPIGTTCSNKSGAVYTSSDDAWGNVTSRTHSGTTATLSYDLLDHFVQWNAGTNNQEWYIYDGTGNRVFKRTINSTSTTLLVYAFGLEEHKYGQAGANLDNTYYYSLGGRLLGALSSSSGMRFYLTDALGSVLVSFNYVAGSAAIKGNQDFGPYGNKPYSQGTINTAKGYTGQYHDSLTGLDYYGSRYYDPVAGVFLSADRVQGNGAGVNPYAYVGGNPETHTDPTGLRAVPGGCIDLGCGNGSTSGGTPQAQPQVVLQAMEGYEYYYATSKDLGASGLPALLDLWFYHHNEWALAETYAQNTLHTTLILLQGLEAARLLQAANLHHFNWNANVSTMRFFMQLRALALPLTIAAVGLGTHGEELATAEEMDQVILESESAWSREEGGLCSFTPTTPVTTAHGKQAIGKLHVGDKVWAYNLKTHKMEQEPILHVWVHSDHDLVDLTITTTRLSVHGRPATQTSEVIHTNQKHPFFTLEQAFLPVSQITPGMHILQADGSFGVVTGRKIVPGTQVMYNLEVAQDHTFAVGDGQWVVHNSCGLPASQADIQKGVDLIQDPDGNFGNESPDINWTFKGVSKPSKIANPRYQGDPYTLRYYFRFEDQFGDPVYISANYDPDTHEWDSASFHYSSGP